MTDNVYDAGAAAAAGVVADEAMIFDYFGFEERTNYFLPDGKQYFTLSKMNEGARARFQRSTRSDATFSRRTDDIRVSSDPAGERHAIITTCVVGWNLYRKDRVTGLMTQVPFSANTLKQWLESADPKIVEKLEAECRKQNPWLLGDMSVEDIDEAIEQLNERRAEAVKQAEGEAASSGK